MLLHAVRQISTSCGRSRSAPDTATRISLRAERLRPTTRCRPEGRRAAVGGAWANPVISCGSSSGRCCTMCRHIENIASARSACPCKRAHHSSQHAASAPAPGNATDTCLSLTTASHRYRTIEATRGACPAGEPVSRCVAHASARPLIPAHARSCPRQFCERMLAQLTAEGRRRT